MILNSSIIDAVANDLQSQDVTHLVAGGTYKPLLLRPCLKQLLVTGEQAEKVLNRDVQSTEFSEVVHKWFNDGVINAINNPVYNMLDRYYHDDWRGVIYTWLEASKLVVTSRLMGYVQPVMHTECMQVFDHLSDETLHTVATYLCFPIENDMLIGESGDYAGWLIKLAKRGILSHDPYIIESKEHKGSVLSIKYNKVLYYYNNRFILAGSDQDLIRTGELPSLKQMYDENCEYLLFMAALSLANYVSSFYNMSYMPTLSDFCLIVFKENGICPRSNDLYADALSHFTRVNESVKAGYRLAKTFAWDFARWCTTRNGFLVEIAGDYVNETYRVEFGVPSSLGCIADMLSYHDNGNFRLITGVMAMFGIYLDSARAWPIDTHKCMPAHDTALFEIIHHL